MSYVPILFCRAQVCQNKHTSRTLEIAGQIKYVCKETFRYMLLGINLYMEETVRENVPAQEQMGKLELMAKQAMVITTGHVRINQNKRTFVAIEKITVKIILIHRVV